MAETAIDNARDIVEKLRALPDAPGLWLVAAALTALIQHTEGLEQLLAEHRHGYRWEPTTKEGKPL